MRIPMPRATRSRQAAASVPVQPGRPRRPNPVTACGCRRRAFVVALLVLSPFRLHAQTGFSPRAAAVQANIERRLLAAPDTASARLMTRDLSARPHMAGTRAQAETRDYVIAKLQSWGLDTWVKEYTVYLPQPEIVSAWVYRRRGAPALRMSLVEPPIPGDPATTGPQVPTFNAYSGDGDVTAPVVNVNYGLDKDYRMLDSLGVSVRGRIAMARYGFSFRGIKAREAERHGAIGLILYSDPQDDGYFHGDIYPRGPMRPAGGIQRGSVLNRNRCPAPGACRRSPSPSREFPWSRWGTGTRNRSSTGWAGRPPRKGGREGCRCTITLAPARRACASRCARNTASVRSIPSGIPSR